MNDDRDRDDDALRARFEELRGEVERPGATPDFAAMLARAESARPDLTIVRGGGRRRHAIAAVGATLAAAALAGLLLVDVSTGDADAEFERLVMAYSSDQAGGAWRSPTASLMDIPGLDLGAVPSIAAPLPEGERPPAGPEGRDS